MLRPWTARASAFVAAEAHPLEVRAGGSGGNSASLSTGVELRDGAVSVVRG